jgi:L-cysteine desulfidase
MAYTIKDILSLEVAPALGCTEPSAVALATAAARSLLPDGEIDSVEIWVDPNIYKNAMAVTIPGARGGQGIDLAAALGALGGDPALKLEVLKPVDDSILKKAREFVQARKVKINLLPQNKGLFIRTQVSRGDSRASATVEEVHDNIKILSLDEKPVKDHPLLSGIARKQNSVHALEEWLSGLSLETLVSFLDDLDEEDMAFLQQGVDTNLALARHGLTYGPGLGVGQTLERLVREGLLKKDMLTAAKILTSAAADARMAGVKMPAMSSGGSGNHGLTAILPIWAVKDYLSDTDQNTILKAIALSHVITAYVKAHTGRLSAVCGCSIAAGAGAAGSLTFLMGGNLHHIAGAIKNLIGDLAGVICDGAKAGCALKLATAAGTAVRAALFALHGLDVKATDGIVADTPEQTMKNVGRLSTQGMIETDQTILNIMIAKQFQNV